MIYEAKQGLLYIDSVPQPQGTHGALIRTDTSQKIPFARYANTETGEWQAWASTPEGEMINPPQLLRGKCPIRFEVSTTLQARRTPKMAKRQPPPIQTPQQTAAEIRKIAKDYGFIELIKIPGVECEYPGCHRLATWQTGDEQIIDPAPGGFERAFTKRVHKYCSDPRHWRAPVRTSIRGVESEIDVETDPNKK